MKLEGQVIDNGPVGYIIRTVAGSTFVAPRLRLRVLLRHGDRVRFKAGRLAKGRTIRFAEDVEVLR